MEEHLIISVIIIIIIYYIYTQYQQQEDPPQMQYVQFEDKEIVPVVMSQEENFTTWDNIITQKGIEPGLAASHAEYVDNVRNYSSGPSFTQVEDDNNSPIFTNFIGFSRPEYVPVGTTARQIPDVNTEALKRNYNPFNVIRKY